MIICLFCAIEAYDLSFMILCWIWFLLPPKLSPAFADGPSSWSCGSTVIIAEMVVATQSVAISWICLCYWLVAAFSVAAFSTNGADFSFLSAFLDVLGSCICRHRIKFIIIHPACGSTSFSASSPASLSATSFAAVHYADL
jgi:hypothetical protein